jgi:hypothetical protein
LALALIRPVLADHRAGLLDQRQGLDEVRRNGHGRVVFLAAVERERGQGAG